MAELKKWSDLTPEEQIARTNKIKAMSREKALSEKKTQQRIEAAANEAAVFFDNLMATVKDNESKFALDTINPDVKKAYHKLITGEGEVNHSFNSLITYI